MVSTTAIVASVAAILTTISTVGFVVFYRPVRKWMQRRKHTPRSYQNTLPMLCRPVSHGILPYTQDFQPSLESIPENNGASDVEKGLHHREVGREVGWPGYHHNPSTATLNSDLTAPHPAHLPQRLASKKNVARGSFKSQRPHGSTKPTTSGSRRTKSNKPNRKLVGTRKEYRFQRKKLALTGIKDPEPMSRISEETSRPSSVALKKLSMRDSLLEMMKRLSAADGRLEMIQVRRGHSDFGRETADNVWLDMTESGASNSSTWGDEAEDGNEERHGEMRNVDLV